MEGGKEGSRQDSRSYWVNLAGVAATKLRSVAPDLTTVKSACVESYGYACRASEAVKGAINVPIEGSRNLMSSWAPDPQSREVILKAVTGSAADEALKAVSSFVPGGDPLYRITKAGAREFSRAYNKKGAQEPQMKDAAAAAAEGLAGSSSLETIEKKLQEMSSEMNELKMQNQMLMEKVSGLSATNQPSMRSSSPSQRLPLLASEAAPAWQKPEDVIRVFVTKGLKGRDLQSALLIPNFAGTGREGSETKPYLSAFG